MVSFFCYSILNDDTSNINVYVGEDGQIHFTDVTGADSVLPFKSGIPELLIPTIQNGIGGNATSQGAFSIVVENYSSLLVENIICSGGYAYVIFNYFNESNNKVLDSSTFATGINKNNFSIDISTVYTLSIVITTQAGSGRVTNLHLF